jgi:aspartate/methionine/tyrosine aminotransferase
VTDDAKLQKVILGPDWIDLSFGEPRVVMDALFRQLNRIGNPLKMPTLYDLPKWEYQPAAGKPDLVKILEDKYDAKVVVCNGAKQALAAAMYSFRRHGASTIYYDIPYYPANPSLAESVGLTRGDKGNSDCFLITSPNNPDGNNYSNLDLVGWRYSGPMIHDAAYYTEIYMQEGEIPLPMGHIQVYSMSKMYGLSGLRIGYAVCHDETYYQDMVNYIEMTTAGVSTASQDIARNIEALFIDNPSHYREFVKEARASITNNRKLLSQLNPDVLTVIDCQSNSMFAWCKKGPKLDSKKAKVHILSGTLFGADDSIIRMNIAVPYEVLKEAIDRLNNENM